MLPNSKVQSDANRTANNIDRNADLYRDNEYFKWMVDNTVYFTDDERHKSMAIVSDMLPLDGFFYHNVRMEEA